LPKINRLTVITGTILLIFVGLIYLFAWSSIFTAKSIVISGAPTVESKELVLSTSGVLVGEKMARIEPRSVAQRLSSLTWIQDVTVSRNWISGDVGITVEPRKPSAYFAGKTIDSTGTIFLLPGFKGADLPYVAAATPALGVDAIALFRSLPPSFRSKIISLSARNESNFSMRLAYQGRELTVKWGASEKSALKVQVFNALLKLPENKNLRRVDLSAAHAPIVK
jgi:cell division septal protein FtsQ